MDEELILYCLEVIEWLDEVIDLDEELFQAFIRPLGIPEEG
jgi:hypothetical protein